jgi:hypothetical protein
LPPHVSTPMSVVNKFESTDHSEKSALAYRLASSSSLGPSQEFHGRLTEEENVCLEISRPSLIILAS